MPEKKEEIIEKLRNSPHNTTFSDIRKLLEDEGFSMERYIG